MRSHRALTRREALKAMGIAGGGVLIGACAPQTTPSGGQQASPVAAASATPAESPKAGGTLKVILDRNVPSFDPHLNANNALVRCMSPAYSLLVQFDPNDDSKIIPDLAEKWDISSDGRSYTFKLRQGVRFHDGAPLTSADVKFSLDRIANRDGRNPGLVRSEFLNAVQQVDVPDPQTVRAILRRPDASFLSTLAMAFMAIVPKHVVEAKGNLSKDVVGSGPFKFSKYEANVRLVFEKNADYLDKPRPYLDAVEFVIITDQTARFAATKTGQTQISAQGGSGPTGAHAAELEQTMKGKVTVWRTQDLTPEALSFNMTRKPWDDQRVRKAMHLGLDRQSYAKLVHDGNFTIGGFLALPGWGLTESEVLQLPGYRQPKDADRAEAKRLLAAAGFPSGFQTKILGANGQEDLRRMQYLQQDYRQIGVDMTIEAVEATAFLQRQQAHSYDTVVGSFSVQSPDPTPILLGTYHSQGTQNLSLSGFPDVDKLIEQQAAELDTAKRHELVREVERKLLDYVPRPPIGMVQGLSTTWYTVRNFRPFAGRWTAHWSFASTWLAAG